ncbi:AAA family ATPase [Phenylobacterium parvum]|uniref:Chromosome partition protein Smc n=1 Tax=Phenylobacterium parvum TaxID=2201350 RepID=A0A2Z3HNA4_9CAUL|nr:AAA family ATPase [Phenylobacterium parvum]AWM76732.1 chromosome segregation protein SMC [Phenylobacterium parvum]
MQFQRLRLSGFKSFVDATELRIEPGITGIVGPNGCGKSNLLEALRWVMGANSAKAMRAGGMDDVIFAGSGGRSSRNHAEVVLTIDNAERRAPAAYNDSPVLEVVRRIDRGEGSTYRINGREVRARDVHLLFADASTGSNSPALVRQGQISELIAAKPQNRRMILEEAAGVSGLHTRRHEAELRLRAAETNLSRLDDIARELDSALNRLRREARNAERYRRLSAEIRTLQSAVLYARWAEAGEAVRRLSAEAEEAIRGVEDTARAAAAASARSARAEAAMPALREAETVAAAVLNKLAIDRDRLEREAEALAEEVRRLEADIARIDADRARETQITADAGEALARLAAEISRLEAEVAAAPSRGPELESALRLAEVERDRVQAEVEALAAQVAAEAAQRRAAETRAEEARSRAARTRRALEQAIREREALSGAEGPEAKAAAEALAAAEAELTEARTALEAAEAARTEAARAEGQAQDAAREIRTRLDAAEAEARGLLRLLKDSAEDGFAPAVDSITPERGLEAALAAALGDDLDAALDPRANAFWRGAPTPPVALPAGAEPLADRVKAPQALAARLALVGLVDRSDGDRLAASLSPGVRLVSREGDLWRWDGFVARADAPRASAVRMAQRGRLAELEDLLAGQRPEAEAAAAALVAAASALAVAEAGVRDGRRRPAAAEQVVAQARQARERHDREAARREAQKQSLDDLIRRFEAEMSETEAVLAAAEAEVAAAGDAGDARTRLEAARALTGPAVEAAAQARAALDAEVRERDGRRRQLERTLEDREDWSRRSAAAAQRLDRLAGERAKAVAGLDAAREKPATHADRLQALLTELGQAEARRAGTSDSLAAAEAERAEATRAVRSAEAAASEVRERRAGLDARLESARERLAEIAGQIRETARVEPEDLARSLADEAVAIPAEAGGVEAHLYNLERQREALGAVNLRAEEEAREYAERLDTLRTEQADLTGAIARLRQGIDELNGEGRERLLAAFEVINGHFQALFQALFEGGQAELRLVESDDPLEAGLEIFACPPGKRLAAMSLMSGGEQALTACALIFAVFLANPAPICVLDEVDAPLDDANVDRFCNMLDEMRRRTRTRFIAITHNPVTMARMDRLFGVTMAERGVSQLVSVDLRQAEALAAE